VASTLGQKLRKLRKEMDLTLDELAERTGSSKSYIWELENKNPPRPSAEKLAKIATELNTTMEFLLDDEEKVGKEEATDASFYRKYRKLDPLVKSKIRQMVKLWGKDE
jgi:transcriptional regulator with XRE-family HTH domain